MAPLHAAAHGAGLSLEERISARRAIEEVYWQHRIWPAANPGVKPPLEAMLPESTLRQQVEDSLRLSEALAGRWQRPITADDLQAELDRMIAESRDLELLAELFAAVGNDPLLAAECLARPLLAERAAHKAFAKDAELHGELQRQVTAELEAYRCGLPLDRGSGTYREMEWVRSGQDRPRWELMAEEGAERRLILDPAAWQQLSSQLETLVGKAAPGELGPLRDDDESYAASTLLERTEGRVLIATVSWSKPSFDQWWQEHRSDFAPQSSTDGGSYQLTPFAATAPAVAGWTATDLTSIGMPAGRAYHSAVWTGSEMIVFGGTDGAGVFYNGGHYSPATNSWIGLPSLNHPDGRAHHSAVWTGERMLVFGGWGASGALDTGGRYNPVAREWYTMAGLGGPSARYAHSAVWNGVFMVVYGGFNGNSYPSDGSLYLASNAWLAMNTNGAPGGRIGHIAVECTTLDDPVMVVWGGENASGPLANGARFVRSSLSWTAMASNGAPSARTNLSGVWGGALDVYRKVLLWGGNNGSIDINFGMAYDPMADDWEMLPQSTLEGRQGHSAVWTGYTMIVWGGASGSTLYGNGGIYNPINKSWRTVTGTGAPSARKGHTAVWRRQGDGQAGQMIVWGGNDGSYTKTGGVCTPNGSLVFAMNPPTFEVTRGGTVTDAVHALLLPLNGMSASLTVSEELPLLNCIYEHNPLIAGVNGFDWTSVDAEVDEYFVAGDYPVTFSGDSGDTTFTHEVTLRVQDFDVTCTSTVLTIPSGTSAEISCGVISENWFVDPVYLSCRESLATCDFAETTITPLANSTTGTTVTIDAIIDLGSFTQHMRADANGATRFFDLQIIVTQGIFSDDFETGNTSKWSVATP